MKTKTLLTYGAIAVGAYLAYKYFMKPKAAETTSLGIDPSLYTAQPQQMSFTGNEDSRFYNKFTANEEAYNPFTGTIAVVKRGENPAAVKKAVRANLGRKRLF